MFFVAAIFSLSSEKTDVPSAVPVELKTVDKLGDENEIQPNAVPKLICIHVCFTCRGDSETKLHELSFNNFQFYVIPQAVPHFADCIASNLYTCTPLYVFSIHSTW